jgi:predicted lysophospholipase L1 biosynthesis ABC-type transport system permease subunit
MPSDTSPLGRVFQLRRGQTVEVVGVARDSRYSALRQTIPPTIYLPFRQEISGQANFEVRTVADPLAIASAIRATVHRVDPSLPIFELRSQDEQINRMMAEERMFALLSAFFAGVALLLTCIGIYGLLANQVAARTREIGVRMALGAQMSRVVGLVLAEGVSLAAIGVVCGSFAAFWLSGFVAHLLYGVPPHDRWSLAGAGSVLLVVTMLACAIPARRAAKVDPMVALRCE